MTLGLPATPSDNDPCNEGGRAPNQRLPHPIKELELPPEIWVVTFSFIRPDSVETLLACTLVCRSWVNIARRRLFQHRIVLFQAYRERPRSRYSLSPEYVTASSTMLPHIQQIHVIPPHRHTPETYESLNEIVAGTSGMLPSLQQVRISDLRWHLLTTRAKTAFSSYGNVTLVFLSHIVLQHVAELGDLLTRINSLREVHLNALVFKNSTIPLSPSFEPAPLSLVNLHLDESTTSIFLQRWLSSFLESQIRLQCLWAEDHYDSVSDNDILNKLIRLYGDTLQKVKLPRWVWRIEENSREHPAANIDFSASKALKYLQFGTEATFHPNKAFSSLSSMLNTFPSGHHLQNLVLYLGTPGDTPSTLYHAWQSEWSMLDNALASLCSRGLNPMRSIELILPHAERYYTREGRARDEDEEDGEKSTDDGGMLRALGFSRVLQLKDVSFAIEVY